MTDRSPSVLNRPVPAGIFVKLAILGYADILLGGVIEYLISSLLYRKQLSEIAMSGLSKSMK